MALTGNQLMSALHLTKLRELDLQTEAAAGRGAYLSAASGLVRVQNRLYVVADDELHLGCFQLLQGAQLPGELLRLLPGELPNGPRKRKKHKPDLEVLMRLPPFKSCPHGALLALGSCSTTRRARGVLLPLAASGAIADAPLIIDTSELYDALTQQFVELNLEGGFVVGDQWCLLQRGNKRDAVNALIRFELSDVLNCLQECLSNVVSGEASLPGLTSTAIEIVDLGSVDGVPLCFSDGCALPDGSWLFTAIAEDTDSAYDDGACVAAAVGLMDAQHRLQWLRNVTPRYKIEGIECLVTDDGLQLLLVTDADDAGTPALLLTASV